MRCGVGVVNGGLTEGDGMVVFLAGDKWRFPATRLWVGLNRERSCVAAGHAVTDLLVGFFLGGIVLSFLAAIIGEVFR